MVFTTTNLFKGIPCPEGQRCTLTNCIYGHQPPTQRTVTSVSTLPIASAANASAQPFAGHKPPTPSADQESEPANKRRRVTYESLADKPLSRAERIKADLDATRSVKGNNVQRPSHLKPEASETSKRTAPASLARPVSPPAAAGGKLTSKQTNANPASVTSNKQESTIEKKSATVKKESLNPRLIPNAPESHGKRTIFVQHIHKDMVRLNNELKASKQPLRDISPEKLKVLALNDQEVIKLALDEEEKAARDQPKVYANVIKNRIAAYRKMKADAFVDVVRTAFNKDAPKPAQTNQGKPIHTGLTPAEEVKVAHHLVVPDQNALAPHGYIPNPPTAAEAEEAAKAVASSMNYEECDRCSARFRVFPDRNDEGKLTTNGPCKHHPKKKVFPTKQKTDFYTGGNQPFYPCCMEQVGSPGCTSAEDHVFKTNSPARLAAVLPFITTPDNPNPAKDRKGKAVEAVGFDCEMGYTAYGLEIIRITAVSWPSHELLLDVLVRPIGTIIDLNSRFSGVWPEHFANAIPYADWKPEQQDSDSLPIVSSPTEARSLLCSFLKPSTPLIGHAIENDLNATRLCHPAIIDTMLLYPHPRGLPMRHGLKALTKKYLERDIQMGGDRGHDSLEDAIATGDLVRVRVARQWREMQSKGWKFERGELVGPGVPAVNVNLEKLMSGAARVKKRTKAEAGLDGVDENDSQGEDEGEGEGLSVEYLESK